MGVKVRDIFWTLGHFDGVIVFDAPDDETAPAEAGWLPAGDAPAGSSPPAGDAPALPAAVIASRVQGRR